MLNKQKNKYICENCCNSCRGELAKANRNHWLRHGAMAWHLIRPEVKGSADSNSKQIQIGFWILHGMQVCWAVTLKASQKYALDVRASSWLVLQQRWPKSARSQMVLLNGRWVVHGQFEWQLLIAGIQCLLNHWSRAAKNLKMVIAGVQLLPDHWSRVARITINVDG